MESQETLEDGGGCEGVRTLQLHMKENAVPAAKKVFDETVLPAIRTRLGGAVIRVETERVLNAVRKKAEKEFGMILETTTTTDVFELIFKVPQSGVKGLLSGRVWNDVDAFFAYSSQDVILRLDVGDRAPDVAGWMARPTNAQISNPLAQANLLPPPELWIEIAFNDGDDLNDALQKIENAVVPQIGATCSCVLIVLQRTPSPTYLKRMGRLDDHGSLVDLSQVTQPAQLEHARPRLAPYVGCWPPGVTNPAWYEVRRDLHIDIPISNGTTFRLNFNRVIGCYGAE